MHHAPSLKPTLGLSHKRPLGPPRGMLPILTESKWHAVRPYHSAFNPINGMLRALEGQIAHPGLLLRGCGDLPSRVSG